jgi:hypothetical protein
MLEPEDIVQAAREIRPQLESLVGPDWKEWDTKLGDLIARAEAGEEDADLAILSDLRSHSAIRAWLRDRLERKEPIAVERAFEPVPGTSPAVPMPVFTCPKCDYTWYRVAVGVPIPLCPTHKIKLVPAAPKS